MKVLGLYAFYYYTAIWQQTDKPRCTTAFAAKALRVGSSAIKSLKVELKNLGLVEDLQSKDSHGKITGHFLQVNFYEKKPEVGKTTRWKPPPVATTIFFLLQNTLISLLISPTLNF
jgi:hypothetical protein